MNYESVENPDRPKREDWQAALQHVERLVDALGKRVDPGIKETVAALNCMGLATDGSCEGHMHNQSKAPWVDFALIPESLRLEIRSVRKALGNGETSPRLDALVREAKLQLWAGEAHIIDLLDEFYKQKNGSAERRLIIDFFPDSARLVSQGARLQDLYPPDIQMKKLRAYQEEMAEFTVFLKARFFMKELN